MESIHERLGDIGSYLHGQGLPYSIWLGILDLEFRFEMFACVDTSRAFLDYSWTYTGSLET